MKILDDHDKRGVLRRLKQELADGIQCLESPLLWIHSRDRIIVRIDREKMFDVWQPEADLLV